MRVTQSMLSNNMLRNLSTSYDRLGKYQDQLATGKKINRPSDDPVVAMKGMNYRTDLTEVEQFQRNVSEAYSWMENTDSAYDKATSALQRIRELVIQASNDTYEGSQRESIAVEIKELTEHIETIANTKMGNKYIFNGSNTTSAPISLENINLPVSSLNPDGTGFNVTYQGKTFTHTGGTTFVNGTDTIEITDPTGAATATNNGNAVNVEDLIISKQGAVPTEIKDVKIELSKGINITVNSNSSNSFNATFFGDLKKIIAKLENGTSGKDIGNSLTELDNHLTNLTSERAEMGARYNRIELIEDRLSSQELVTSRMLSENEDADIEKVITQLTVQESVHRAALGVGAKIIQPTLLDFLR
ncbi:flagellar hook-associated protein FlgL [Bacillus suaedaesalsae]|uniref:Flagellar hook-associated protein FlgL n=1 Tax=Bacillus suaedaesalsae TaxID=2810349 RepID=A0ABS2DKL1_9BACI|nr:flagellar hook-associated protein FlgL [Bacillus suaedaesalsae]MBM6619044.1 flagellar hook-associated protein FlgL [Bacillus suaedaesalsae]